MAKKTFARSCGNCTACCKTHEVSEVNSVAGVYCQYCQISKGCSIYEKRPFPCRKYACAWLHGKGEETHRPDRLKIVMDGFGFNFDGNDMFILNFWEVEEGAIYQPGVEQTMVANIQAGNIVVHRPLVGLPTYYFPKGMLSPEDQQRFIHVVEHESW